MKSRVERYYENDSEMPSRSSKNQDLYNSVSKDSDLIKEEINLDTNEIDISKIKNKFSNREEYQRVKEYQETFAIDSTPSYYDEAPEEPEEVEEERVYDINSILETAKQSREKLDVEQKYKRLKNTSYDILSNLDLGMKDTEEDLENTIVSETRELNINSKPKTQEDELRQLINTITMQKVTEDEGLTQVDLEKELLTEVNKGSVVSEEPEENPAPKGIFEIKEQTANRDVEKAREIDEQLQRTIRELKEEKEQLEQKTNVKEETKIVPQEEENDEDFFTSSYKFSKKDFKKSKQKDLKEEEAKLGVGAKILIVLLIVVIVLVFIYLFNLIFIA